MRKIALLSLVQCLFSCGIHQDKQAKNPQNSFNNAAEVSALLSNPQSKISYEQINRLILKDNCIRCHNPSNAKGDVSIASFAEVRASLSDIQYSALTTQEMPPKNPLSADLQNLLQMWIEQGAPEVVSADVVETPTPTASPVSNASPTPASTPSLAPILVATYASIREGVFVPKCLKCHSEGERAEDFPLDSYVAMMAVSANEKGEFMIVSGDPSASTLVKEIEAGKMPTKKSGLPPVTPEELNVIRQWILEGAKEKE